MDMELIALCAGLLGVIIGVLAYYRSGKPLTFDGLIEMLSGSRTLGEQIAAVAKVVVSAIEQLKDTGKIKTNEEAFETAMEYMEAWFPGVDPELLIPFIEDAYRGLKAAKKWMEPINLTSETGNLEDGTSPYKATFHLSSGGLTFGNEPNDAG